MSLTFSPILTEHRAGRLLIWDLPQDGFEYVIGADMAEGRQRDRSLSQKRKLYSYSNEKPDYTCAVVIEQETARHLATWHGSIQPDQFVHVLYALGLYYNQALLVPEVNGPGVAVVDGLLRLEYPRIYRSRLFNYVDQELLRNELGWRTSNLNRHTLLARVSEVLNFLGITRDAKLVDELSTLEIDASGIPRARGHNKDDRVFAFALALQGRIEQIAAQAQGQPVDKNVTHLSVDDRAVYAALDKHKEQHDRTYLRPGARWRPTRRR